MAISTYMTFLMVKGDSDWEKLIDIKDFPDLGGQPETLDTTTLSDRMKTSILGIQSLDTLTFTANFDLEEYKKLEALKGQQKDYAIWLGGTETPSKVTPTGDNGKFQFKGELGVFVKGAGVNAVADMQVSIAPATPIAQVA